jgi:predicted HicB family RNase H-like nuclease
MSETIVQLHIRVDKEIRDQVKIMAIRRGMTQNELLLEYLETGLEKDEKSLK